MTKDEAEKIIEEECACDRSIYALFKMRERILAEVAGRRARSDLPEDYRAVLMSAIALDRTSEVLRRTLSSDPGSFQLTFAQIDSLLLFYENCRKLCEFLIGEYDKLPDCFRKNWEVDHLVTAAAHFDFRRDAMCDGFAEEQKAPFDPGDIVIMRSLALWACIAILGEEEWCYTMAEANDALAVSRTHLKLAEPL